MDRGLLLVAVAGALCGFKKPREREHAPPPPAPVHRPAANGAIFQASFGYAPLTSGYRAAAVGDILLVVLTERTAAAKSASASHDKDGKIGLLPPATGPLSAVDASDLKLGGNQSFKGGGQASQTNSLAGEISVTVVEALPGGLLRVRGEKAVRLNKGDEFIRLEGLVRAADVSPDNRVPSTRIADARIGYTGRGQIARASRQGWLQRFFGKLSPL